METDQVLKQLEWLDDERRRDKDTIAKQEDRILALEGNLSAAIKQIKDLGSELTRFSTLFERMDRFDEAVLQSRVELKQQIDEQDKQTKKREEEMEKIRRVEMRAVDNSIAEVRKELEPIDGLRRGLQARVEEENRLGRSIDELRQKLQEYRRSEEESTRTYRLLEDGRRQDAKRLVDLQGEVAAMRKRVDEMRGKTELATTNYRKIESRLTELLAVESERKDAQAEFLEKQALLQVERDRIWKDWEARFETVEKQTADVEGQLQAMDATHRSIQRAKEAMEELSERVERRINEITEMQRLGEERFRQEWVTFKADDQKRWTNYTLTQEEQRNEFGRQLEKILERITNLEDSWQEAHDLIAQMSEQSEKRLQSLLALAHDWVSAYERTLGQVR